MEIIKSYKEEVTTPDNLEQKLDNNGEWKPWCPDHKEFYEFCNCPKPNSTPENDGWQIYKKGGKLYGSPTREIYEARALWIEICDQAVECTRCGEKMDINDYIDMEKQLDEIPYSELISHAIDTFYDKHIQCEGSEATEKLQSAGRVKS